MNSCISEMPGPEVAVNERAPFQAPPITIPIDASSSSAWTIANRLRPVAGSTRYRWQCFAKASASDDEGVIGYHAQTVAPPKTAPSADALLPSTKMRLPTLSRRSILSPIGCEIRGRVVEAQPERLAVGLLQRLLALVLLREQRLDDLRLDRRAARRARRGR